jgi:hypothetical protein
MECPECRKVIQTPSKFKRHMLVHSNSFEFKCECGKLFKTKDNLTRHKQKCQVETTLFNADTFSTFESSTCQVNSSSSASTLRDSASNSSEATNMTQITTDINFNTPVKPKKEHKCIECLKTFHSSSNLSRHAKQHVPKVYSCIECTEIFTKWSLLQKHKKQVHKYKCRVCDLVLKTQDNLKKHLKVHDVGRKLYGCVDCVKVILDLSYF